MVPLCQRAWHGTGGYLRREARMQPTRPPNRLRRGRMRQPRSIHTPIRQADFIDYRQFLVIFSNTARPRQTFGGRTDENTLIIASLSNAFSLTIHLPAVRVARVEEIMNFRQHAWSRQELINRFVAS